MTCCPDIQLLPDIARYFGVSIDELMGYESASGKVSTDSVFDEIRNMFSKTDEEELSALAFKTAVLLHEGMIKGWYRGETTLKNQNINFDVERLKDWGGSFLSEKDGETAMVAGALAFSCHRYYKGVSQSELSVLAERLSILSDKNALKIVFALYDLSLDDDDKYSTTLEEIAENSGLSMDSVETALKSLGSGMVTVEEGKGCRMRGWFRVVPSILRIVGFEA